MAYPIKWPILSRDAWNDMTGKSMRERVADRHPTGIVATDGLICRGTPPPFKR
jgi:hypothetical protein